MLVLVIWATLFAPQIFSSQVFVIGDAAIYRPFAEFSRARWLEQHERTFWNPYVVLGIPAPPSLADPRPQYLPGLIIDAYERIRMPHAWPLAGPLLAHLAGMLATAALARRLWRVDSLGATWAAAAWGLMPGLLIPFAFGHDAQFVSASLLPVVMLSTSVATGSRGNGALAGGLALALALGIQCLTGHPQIVVVSAVSATVLAAFEVLRAREPRRLLIFAGAALLGAAVAAALWWPAFLYATHTFRGEGVILSEVARYSLAARDLLTLVWPRAVGFGGETYWGGLGSTDYSPYLGATVVALAFWAWMAQPRRRPSHAWLLAGLTFIAVLMSLGTNLDPVYSFLHRNVPLWSHFRIPFYGLIVAQLAMALLSARVFETTRNPSASDLPGPVTRSIVGMGSGIAILIGVGLSTGLLSGIYGGWLRSERPDMTARIVDLAASAGSDLILRALLVGLSAAVLVWSARRVRGARALRWGLVALLALDLGSMSVPFLVRSSGPASLLAPPPAPEIARLTARESAARALSVRKARPGPTGAPYSEALSNFWISWRARSITGVHGALPSTWREVYANKLADNPHVLRAFGLVYFGCDDDGQVDPRVAQRVTPEGTEPVYRFAGALGRLYAVPKVVASRNDVETATMLTDSLFFPESVAVASSPAAAGLYPGSRGCRLRWMEDGPDRLAFETDSPESAFVVVADTHFPGWEARVDDREIPIHRVDLVLRGLALPAGRHRVEMSYVPEGWIPAMWTTRAALATWIGLGLLFLVAGRRRGSVAVP